MSCFPECSVWCECVGNDCVPLPVAINAVRLRTPDGRYLRSTNIGQGLIVAANVAVPGPSETFLFVAPAAWPMTSGSTLALAVCTLSWTRAASLIRVDHNVFPLPRTEKSDRLVTYEVGGPDTWVFDSPPLPAGYPAYTGDDPTERIFTMVSMAGGAAVPPGTPISTGDEIVLRIDSNRGNVYFFRVTSGQSGAEVHGDGTVLGQADTVFVVDFNEVRAGVGWRPTTVSCRSCAAVTAVVRRAAAGNAPIRGAAAKIDVSGHTYQGVTGANGRAALAEGDGNTCVPSGNVTVRASADRYRDGSVSAVVPVNLAIDVVIPLECTPVKGKVVDAAGSGLPGVSVYLRDQNNMILRDANGNPFSTTTAADGSFVFMCVQHGFVQVWTTAAPTQMQHTKTIGPDGWINVTIVAQTGCGNLVGRVEDADTGQPIAGATVTESGGRTTTTDANGNFTFTCVQPAGPRDVFASAPGYAEDFASGVVPTTGTSAPVVIKLHKVSVIEIQIRLDWGSQPSDLDSHLSGPDLAGMRFHCFFADKTPVPYVQLDADDTTSFGPETITIRRSPATTGNFVAGDYHYWVHDYSSTTFAGSMASVSISSADGQGVLTPVAYDDIANAAGSPTEGLWYVVNLAIDVNGTVLRTDIQTLQPGNSATVL